MSKTGNRPEGHDEWACWDPKRENYRTFESRQAAEERQDEMRGLANLELFPPGESPEALFHAEGDPETDAEPEIIDDNDRVAEVNEQSDMQADVVDHSAENPDPADTDLPKKQLSENPLDWVPSHFVDEIEGVPTINRKGYAVIAEHFGISVTAEPVTKPSETDFEYAEFQATATTPDGIKYSGWGSAHVDRGDDKTLLAELSETRAMKRATAWATGVGMTAVEELQNEIQQ
jgi:hypothetical protein